MSINAERRLRLSKVSAAFAKVSEHYSASATGQGTALARNYRDTIDLSLELEQLLKNDEQLKCLTQVASKEHGRVPTAPKSVSVFGMREVIRAINDRVIPIVLTMPNERLDLVLASYGEVRNLAKAYPNDELEMQYFLYLIAVSKGKTDQFILGENLALLKAYSKGEL